ncbi:MAG: dihydropteroate synthase [Candidatus Omnitrophica bacterium]|nr:dihydropteroate synthase [Candidatus Omnitrophota bacterium]
MLWKARNINLSLDRPLIMGILNLTPDSFYDGGRFLNPDLALEQAFRLVKDGADILDLGAESTRPGAKVVSAEEELSRLLPVLAKLRGQIHIPISVDTTKSRVARRALEEGVHVINDVSGLRQDSEMASVVKEFGAGLVLMHRRGTPETMQLLTDYEDLIEDISRELSESMAIAESHGISQNRIVLDPGIGFSKTAEQNLELLERLSEFKSLGRPLLVGPSRKSFMGAITKQAPDKRLFGTVAACVLAYERGANILRVHDVWAVKEALAVAEAILNSEKKVSL